MALTSRHSRIKLIRTLLVDDGPKGVSKYDVFSHDLAPYRPYLISTALVLVS
jgi:hypothetical protein